MDGVKWNGFDDLENERKAYKQGWDDAMEKNGRLRSCLKAFYFDTMYKDNPGLHDLTVELLAPHDEEFAEVKRTKGTGVKI